MKQYDKHVENPYFCQENNTITSDFLPQITPHPALSDNGMQDNPLRDITITFNSEKSNQPVIMEIAGRKCLGEGDLGGVVSGIGFGKSHLTEIFASLAICPDCDPLIPVKVHLNLNQKAVLFDTERNRDDCIDTLYRIWRRVGQDMDLLADDGLQFRQLEIITTSELPTIAERWGKLLACMERDEVKIIFLDGIVDFAHDANNPEKCGEFVQLLFAKAKQTRTAVFYTIHGNRGDVSGKAKGHLGEIMQRKSTAFFQLKRHGNDPKVRVLTLDFDHRKVRNDDDSGVDIAMAWNSKIGAFSGVEYTEDGGTSLEGLIEKLYFEKRADTLSYSELYSVCQKHVSKPSFDRKLRGWVNGDRFLTKRDRGRYSLYNF